MSLPEDWLHVVATLLPLLAFGSAILYVGYVAYESRATRERLAREPAFDPQAPLRELAQANEQLAAETRATRALLASTREAVRQGVQG